MKEYKRIEAPIDGKDVIHWFEGNTNGFVIEGQTRTRQVQTGVETVEIEPAILDEDGGELAPAKTEDRPIFETVEYSPYDELIAEAEENNVTIAPYDADGSIAKAEKLDKVNSMYNAFIESLVSKWPAHERATFTKQEYEARAFLAGDTSSTPTIDGILAGRNETDKELLCTKIIQHADALANISGLATGQRQAYTKLIESGEVDFEIIYGQVS